MEKKLEEVINRLETLKEEVARLEALIEELKAGAAQETASAEEVPVDLSDPIDLTLSEVELAAVAVAEPVADQAEPVVPEEDPVAAGFVPAEETEPLEEEMTEIVPEEVLEDEISAIVPEEDMPEDEISAIAPEEMPEDEISAVVPEDMPVDEISAIAPEDMPVDEMTEIAPEDMPEEYEISEQPEETGYVDEPIEEEKLEAEAVPAEETENLSETAPEDLPEAPGSGQFSLFGEELPVRQEPARGRRRRETIAEAAANTRTVADMMETDIAWRNDIPGPEVKSLRSAIALGDQVLFIARLFRKDSALYQDTVDRLNSTATMSDAIKYLSETFPEWDLGSDDVYKFMMAVRRKIRK